jgi:hypothetical protein
MNSTTSRNSTGLPSRPVRGALDKETIARARSTPWEPGASSGAPRVLVGLVGAALIGGVAVAIVLLSPSRVAKPVHPADPAAISQTAPPAPGASSADALAAQMNAEPAAAGNAPAVADPRAADTPAPSTTPTAPDAAAPDLRTTRDPRPAQGKTNPAGGE